MVKAVLAKRVRPVAVFKRGIRAAVKDGWRRAISNQSKLENTAPGRPKTPIREHAPHRGWAGSTRRDRGSSVCCFESPVQRQHLALCRVQLWEANASVDYRHPHQGLHPDIFSDLRRRIMGH